tara:strand:- start:11622 stop:12557 length:936 start_codon:yes stop_codon:yes gene_type:complete
MSSYNGGKNTQYTGIPQEEMDQVVDLSFSPSTIETIDYAIYDFINDELSLRTTTNKGVQKVSVVWASAERAHQIKSDKEYRDNEGLIILPAITIERATMTKNPNSRGAYYGGMFPFQTQKEKGGSLVIAKRIKQDKTSNFANADANRRYNNVAAPKFVRKATNKVVYETVSIPPIVYTDITYRILLRTEYQQQMNDLVQPFITRPGTVNSFLISRDGHRYEAFVQPDFTQNNNISSMENEERRFETSIDIRVLAYLVGEGINQDTPKFSIRENAVQVRIPREHVVWDDPLVTGGPGKDSKRNVGVDGKYRE